MIGPGAQARRAVSLCLLDRSSLSRSLTIMSPGPSQHKSHYHITCPLPLYLPQRPLPRSIILLSIVSPCWNICDSTASASRPLKRSSVFSSHHFTSSTSSKTDSPLLSMLSRLEMAAFSPRFSTSASAKVLRPLLPKSRPTAARRLGNTSSPDTWCTMLVQPLLCCQNTDL